MPTGNLRTLRRRAFAFALTCTLTLPLAACHHAPPPPSNATPERAVATSLRLAALGDFDGLMKNRLPAADYAQWRAEWNQAHAQPLPPTVVQQDQFAQIMRMLTAPGAETKLAQRLQPELADLHAGKSASMPIFAGIFEAAGQQMIANSPQLDPAQKALATQGLNALLAWAKTTDFSDPKEAQKAIDLACATARQLHVATLAQWRALDYAATMQNYGIIWNGLESLLQIYDLDVGQSLLDAKISAVADDGVHATLKLDMTLAGQPLTGAWPMVKQDGHWYDAALLDAWRKAHPAPASARTAARAAASTVTQPAATSTTPASSSITSALASAPRTPASSSAATKPAPASSGAPGHS